MIHSTSTSSHPSSDMPLPSASATPMIVEADQKSFMAEVVETSRTIPVLVDFWATWCEPCKQLTPLLEEVVKRTTRRIKLVKVDIDANPALVAQLGQLGLPLQSIPLIVAFWKGQIVDLFQGIKPQSFLQNFVEELLKQSGQSLPTAALLATAALALKEKRPAEAAGLYTQILENEAENPAAWAGLIRSMIALNDLESAQEASEQVPPSLAHHTDITGARTALSLYQEGKKAASTLDHLRQKVANSPHDPALQMQLATALNGAGQREQAGEILLTLIRENRTLNNDAAKNELLRFFEAWGATDPLTLQMRRTLSSILFS